MDALVDSCLNKYACWYTCNKYIVWKVGVHMDKSRFIWGVLTGATASAVAILFTAPKSGQEVRSQIRATSTTIKHDLSDVKAQFQEVKASLQNLLTTAKEVTPEAVQGIKESVDTWQKETAPIQMKIQQDIEAIQKSMDELQQALPKKTTKVS